MKLLADTSALLALLLADDEHHLAAKHFLQENAKTRLVITELILAEAVTHARARLGAARAVEFAGDVLGSRRYDLLFVDADLLEGALRQMKRFADKRLSLTDCASFEVLERLGLGGAFSFDRDFRDCGHRMVP